MANIINTTPNGKTPRGGRLIMLGMLTSKNGASAAEMLKATNGTTAYSWPSLSLLADSWGYELTYVEGSEYEDGHVRYFFTAPVKKATKAKAPVTVAPMKAAASKVAGSQRKVGKKAA